jgi:hypothetical protein
MTDDAKYVGLMLADLMDTAAVTHQNTVATRAAVNALVRTLTELDPRFGKLYAKRLASAKSGRAVVQLNSVLDKQDKQIRGLAATAQALRTSLEKPKK